jgi:SAM-dependent methyltransferase
MNKPEFDQYADQYDRLLSDTIPDSLNEDGYFAEYKISLMHALLGDVMPARILDFGCGAGRSLPFLDRYFPSSELWGYDVSPESIRLAAQRVPRASLHSDWNSIASTTFDVVIATNVFHHIPPAERSLALMQCRQVLADQGQMFLFEHNPFNPVTRWIFERCPFDQDAEMLSMKSARNLASTIGMRIVDAGYTLFFPRPLAWLRPLERSLRWLPLGAQYYVQMTR